MIQHPHLMLSLAEAQQRQMITAAERHNRLSAARRYRRAANRAANRLRRGAAAREEGEAGASAPGRPDGNFAPCGGHVAGQVG
ncbi:hypothetical protein [Actinopolymorpha pittospori]|uniref:Uncharacterized protein n=1 Tax=Actinopolymorpha pittospori TaxID=648752 RepID=A0A927N550_9ACTN|nr:hypothetical protein [Actinopolymorpha pittospori]MBE1612279.1 hypothetical protein [Actinopolymorpha pittospori]